MLLRSNISKALLLSAAFLLITGCVNDEKNDGRSSRLRGHTTTSQTTVPASPTIAVQGLKQLTVTVDKTVLNKDENTTVKVQALYDDRTSKEMTGKVEWIVTPKDAVSITNDVLVAKKDTHTMIQAKLGSVVSNVVALDITWTVNGHTLPPEPDSKVNNATLLGVDVNNNGVRDDVERWIYEKFPREIRRKQLMQRAKSHQGMLADREAIKNASKWQKIIANKNIACASYLYDQFDIEFDLEADTNMKNMQYNNKDRVMKYLRFNNALGGNVYFTPESMVNENSCEFNVTKALKD